MKVSDAFPLNFVLLQVFTRRLPLGVRSGVVKRLLNLPHLLYIILNLLEAGVSTGLRLSIPFVTLQELVRLVSVVDVAVTLPLDVESLPVNADTRSHSRGWSAERPFRLSRALRRDCGKGPGRSRRSFRCLWSGRVTTQDSPMRASC